MQQPTDIYSRLMVAFGPQGWWPADTPFEVIVGAVLTQNTNWRNVEKAIANLKSAGVLTPSTLWQLSATELAELIRPSGYFRIKAQRLRNVVEYLMQRHSGSTDTMFSMDSNQLRRELLAINGIGPETADSILLYAGNQPHFVVDTYTQRVVQRHGWVAQGATYEATQRFFTAKLDTDVSCFNEFHALIVKLAKVHCRKAPLCQGCPLESVLPPEGPRGLV